jgi:hypothetical protein
VLPALGDGQVRPLPAAEDRERRQKVGLKTSIPVSAVSRGQIVLAALTKPEPLGNSGHIVPGVGTPERIE